MLSSVDSSNTSATVYPSTHSIWQKGDLILEVDPPECAHRIERPRIVNPGTVRAMQEPQGQGPALKARDHDAKFSSTQKTPSSIWRGLMRVKKWFTGLDRRYRDDREALLLIETRKWPPPAGPPSIAETMQSINILQDIHVWLPTSIVT